MEAIASSYRHSGWANDFEKGSEIGPTPPPRIQSRMNVRNSKPSNAARSVIPQHPKENKNGHVEAWPVPPLDTLPSVRSSSCENEIDFIDSDGMDTPISQSPGRITPEAQLGIGRITSPVVMTDDDKRMTLTSMMEPLSVSPATSSLSLSQDTTCDDSPSTTNDEDIYDPELRNFAERMKQSYKCEAPMPPPRMQSRTMSEIGLWQACCKHEYDLQNNAMSEWVSSTLPRKGKRSPEIRPWLAPPIRCDFLPTHQDLRYIPVKVVEERPWLAPPHQGRLTPEGGAAQPILPPHHGRVTPVAQASSRPSSYNGEGISSDEYWPRKSVCQCHELEKMKARPMKADHSIYVRSVSSPPPPPPHKGRMVLPMRQLSMPNAPPLPPHKGRMTPTEASSTSSFHTRARHRVQEGVQLRNKDPNTKNTTTLYSSAKSVFRRWKSGILAHSCRSTEMVDSKRQTNRRSAPALYRSDRASLRTQSSENSSFHDHVKELVSSVDLGECFIM